MPRRPSLTCENGAEGRQIQGEVRRAEGVACTRPRPRFTRSSHSLKDIQTTGEASSLCFWLPVGSRFGSHHGTGFRKSWAVLGLNQ